MTDPRTGSENRYFVPGLARGLALLGRFTRETPELGPSELARELGLPRSTVFRLAQTLEELGYLRRVSGSRNYRLGPAVLSLGFEYLASQELPESAGPALERLRDDTGASAHLAVRDGDAVVYLSRYASRSALSSNIRVGSRLAAHASSMGRVLLSELDDESLAALYGGRALARYTDQTPTDLAGLRVLLAGDRRRGHVVGHSYFENGVTSAAAPIRDTSGDIVAAINLTGPEGGSDPDMLRDAVVAAAAKISAWLGYRPRKVSRDAAE